MAMDLKFLIGAEDQTGAATESAKKNISSLNKSAADSGSVFDRLFSGGGGAVSQFMGKVSSLSAQFLAIKFAGETAFHAIAAAIVPGVEAVENFTMSVTKTAALITSFKGGDNIAQTYQQAKGYAEGLQETLEVIDAKTIASAQDLGLITDEMLKQRVVLDVNNQKQIDGYTNLANAVAVVAQGAGAKEIQIRQEIRALMTGEVNAQSTLASQINAMVGGGLKEKVALWKQEGTLIENIGKALQGYAAAQGDIASTWGAVKSSTESIVNAILRAGFKNVFKELVGFMDDLNKGAKENSELIGNKIQQAWLVARGIVESVVAIVRTFSGPLGVMWEATKLIVEGWGLLLYAILPPLLDRVAKFGQAVWEDIKMVGNLISMLWNGLSFNFEGAFAAFDSAKANFLASGRLSGQAFASGLGDEINNRAAQFLALDLLKGKTKTTVETPDLGKAPATEEEKKAIAGAATALAKYADGIKEVGKARLDLGTKAFTDDLKRQADLLNENGRIFGDIQAPIKQYLSLIDDVESQQKKLEDQVGTALDKLAGQRGGKDEKGKLQADLEKAEQKHQLNLLTIQKTAADERLKAWQSFYDNLKAVVEKKEREIESLQEKMMQARTKITEAIDANNKKLQDPGRELDAYEARLKAKEDILSAIAKATAGGGDMDVNLKTLDSLIAKAQELASAVRMDNQDVISQVDAVNQSNELLRAIGDAQDKLHQEAISRAEADVAKLKEEMKNAIDNVKAIRSAVEELDDRIAKMQTTISLVADDKVSPVLDKIKQQIDALRNSSISIGTQYQTVYPNNYGSPSSYAEGSFASGTRYVSKTGLYQLHQGETVKNRGEVSREERVTQVSFGDVTLSFPNVTNQSTGADLAREALPELMRLMKTRFKAA